MPPKGLGTYRPPIVTAPADLPAVPDNGQRRSLGLTDQKAEHDALVEIWTRFGAEQWTVGFDTWRYMPEARDWPGVTVEGGEAILNVPEENLFFARYPHKDLPLKKLRFGETRYKEADLIWIETIDQESEGRVKGEAKVEVKGKSTTAAEADAEAEPRRTGEILTATTTATRSVATMPRRFAIVEHVHRAHAAGDAVVRFIYDCRFLDGTVTRLDLTGNNCVATSLPARICEKLPSLVELRLEGNNLGGEIDVVLLRAMLFGDVEASLGANDPGFTLPSDVDKVVPAGQTLAAMEMPWCSLRGHLPERLAALPALAVLDLSNNRLSGPIPESFSALRSLEVLDLNRNQLTGPLPVFISGWLCLRSIDLSRNNFSGLFPSSWVEVDLLVELNLSGNPGLDQINLAAAVRHFSEYRPSCDFRYI